MSDVMVTGYGNLSKSHGKFPQTSGKTEEGLSPDKLSNLEEGTLCVCVCVISFGS